MPEADPPERLAITETPRPADLGELHSALVASRPATAHEDRRPLAAFVRDDDGVLVGGIAGHTHFGWAVIDELWVAQARRGQGLGRRLLLSAEHEARRRGCHSVWLSTYSFQARPFYEAHGYALFGELTSYPDQQSKQFLAKRL